MAGGHGPHLSLLKVTWDFSAHISCTKVYCEEGRTEEEWEMLSCSQEERNWNDVQHPVITSHLMDLSVKLSSKNSPKHGQTLLPLVQARIQQVI